MMHTIFLPTEVQKNELQQKQHSQSAILTYEQRAHGMIRQHLASDDVTSSLLWEPLV
jgi:hypothetical protein